MTSARANNYGLNSYDLDDNFGIESPYYLDEEYSFKCSEFIAPVALFALGSLSLYSSAVESVDISVREAVGLGHSTISFDDYLQYSPAIVMLGLNIAGLDARHKIKQQVTLVAISAAMTSASVYVAKTAVGRHRPDTGADNSFPSGHTATAFMCAEMLHKEYGEYSPWISVAGYGIASATAFCRVYNDRHWMTDTLAGAGVGMLCAKFAYWIGPKVNRALWGSATGYDNELSASITPYSSNGYQGVNLSIRF